MRLFDKRLAAGSRFYFFGERFGGYKNLDGSSKPPPYYMANVLIDLFATYKFNESASLDFSVENLTDRHYVDPMATAYLVAPGRTARLGMTVKF